MSVTIVVVVGNPKAASRTLTVADTLAKEIVAAIDADATVEVVELAECAAELFDWGSPTVAEAVGLVRSADLLVVASPVYKASYTGLLKAFLDRFASGALNGVVAVPLMVGGAAGHALAVDVHLRPLLVELGATCTSPGLFVLETEVENLEDVVSPWLAATAPLLRRVLL